MKQILISLVVAATVAISSAGVISANHDHDLITPGTTVVDIADGQTEKCATDPGGHQYHVHVHIGAAGSIGFANPNNPVSVVKTENATC